MKSLLLSRMSGTFLDAFDRAEIGTLHLTAPGGISRYFEGKNAGPNATFHIRDWNTLMMLISRGDIGLGEAYIDGLWDSDDLDALFQYFLLNLDQLESYAHGNWWNRLLFNVVNHVIRRNTPKGSSSNIKEHYDVGNDFYSLWLDQSMTYSSALFPKEGASLEVAQEKKYSRILERIGSEAAQVLEVGCGWGGFAEAAAREGRQITGITVSPSQFHFASQRLGTKADIRLEDYRHTTGTFDAIVSIEMFEAVGERYWPTYFSMLKDRLSSKGTAVIQTITVDDSVFPGYRTRSDFIRHYTFPGGMLPSVQRFREEAQKVGFVCRDVFRFGHDYARTLREWTARFDQAEPQIRALGHGTAFMRSWRFYLAMCAAAFEVGRTDVVQIELAHA
ncbi:MAG: cyclopropane-fatty-acyl-phospholipid synthase family protein [Rickettsiales bacterium]|nr:cyclopropane-fatty-acyl-phospholipid synthase family protein [Rickettsiales bacterium]